MRTSPCRRIHLGITHPVVGKYFQALEVHRGMEHIQDLSCEKGPNFLLFLYFVKLWTFIQFLLNFGQKNPVLVYVNEKFCNEKLIWTCST